MCFERVPQFRWEDWWAQLRWWAVGIFVAANVRAYLADFEYVRFFGVFRAGYLERVPKDVVLVQEGIGNEDDAISQGFFFEVPSDDVASRV